MADHCSRQGRYAGCAGNDRNSGVGSDIVQPVDAAHKIPAIGQIEIRDGGFNALFYKLIAAALKRTRSVDDNIRFVPRKDGRNISITVCLHRFGILDCLTELPGFFEIASGRQDMVTTRRK